MVLTTLRIDAPVLNALDASLLSLGYKRTYAITKIIEKFVSDSDTKSPTEIISSLSPYGKTAKCLQISLRIDDKISDKFIQIVKRLGVPKINIINRLIFQFNALSDAEKIDFLSR